MFYDDELTRAIKTKFAPDIRMALRDAPNMDFIRPSMQVNVPLRADVAVIYEKDLAAFAVRGRIVNAGADKNWLSGQAYFSTEQISTARDKVAIVEYLFNEARDQMIRAILNKELDSILNT